MKVTLKAQIVVDVEYTGDAFSRMADWLEQNGCQVAAPFSYNDTVIVVLPPLDAIPPTKRVV